MSKGTEVTYHPKASSHWYTMDGEPMHTYINSKGGESNVTLRQARKFDLVPSVTTILKTVPKPGVERWKVKLALEAGLKAKTPEEAVEIYEHETTVAAKRGTRIHKAVEEMLGGRSIAECSLEFDVWMETLEAVQRWIESVYAGDVVSEKPFATNEYGGCIDLWSPHLLTDIKTSTSPKRWPEHAYQAAGYLNACPAEDACILLVSSIEPGQIEPVMFSAEELDYGLAVFNDAKRLWQRLKKWEVKR